MTQSSFDSPRWRATWEFVRRARRWLLEYWPQVVIALFSISVAYFSWRFHEPFRDEVQLVLTAREVPWARLIAACRVEGATPVVYIVAKLLSAPFSGHASLAIIGGLSQFVLLSGMFRLVTVVSRRRFAAIVVTLAFATTFSLVYELGVIVRQYACGLGFSLFAMAYFYSALEEEEASDRNVVIASVFAGLASLTVTHAGCVSLSVALVHAIVCAEEGRWRRVALTAVGAAPAAFITLYLISPYGGRTPIANAAANPTWTDIVGEVRHLFFAAHLPESRWGYLWPSTANEIAKYLVAAVVLAAATEVIRTKRLSASMRVLFGGVALGWLPLLYIFVIRYRGFHRHHLFLTTPILVVTAGYLARELFTRGRARFVGIAGFALMTPWFLLQWDIARFELRADLALPYCATKAVAKRLPSKAHVISDTNYSAIGVLFWRPDISLRSCDGEGRVMRYNPPDAIWLNHVPMDPLIRQECQSAPSSTFVVTTLAYSRTPLVSACARGDASYTVTTRDPSEANHVFAIDCDCVAKSKVPGTP